MIYLASPYSDPDPAVREARFDAACAHTATMIRAGRLVYSPIVHSHPLANHGLGADWDFWAAHDRAMLGLCEALVVLELPGWQQSVGVRAEVAIARELGLPVEVVDPADVCAETS